MAMIKYSQSSSSSTVNSTSELTIPSSMKCWYGFSTPILTSKTTKTRGRKFIGRGNFKGSERSWGFFKWLDEACTVLIQMEGEIGKIKADHERMKNDIEEIIKQMNFHLDFCLQNIGHHQQKNYGK
ncbi:hypothetical protein M9H77_11429 [Catharanthus roseus]|uniref:Uncharacterized protein n=1 Tax=Catharanthus roseus TaxID=4058 RepID=A0ACC0BEL7_CATRO|nr:hypothetical protein M9H77_11429 [Catharanthus roseus]